MAMAIVRIYAGMLTAAVRELVEGSHDITI